MKLLLQVTAAGAGFSFEHRGPVVRIGRDPEVELSFSGDSSQGVSWHHARIDLAPDGAVLSDLGSTNGTLLNDHRIPGRVPLKRGDQVRLGYTGPSLNVVELDLSSRPAGPAVAAGSPFKNPADTASKLLYKPGRREVNLLVAAAVAGAVLMVGVVVLILWQLSRPTVSTEVASGTTAAAGTAARQPAPPPVETKKVGNDAKGGNAEQDVKKDAPKEPQPAPPPAPRDFVGVYVPPEKGPPSVLVQRQRDTDPWGKLQPSERLFPEHYLASLPGYRSHLHLKTGVRLMLWGMLPEFGPISPVLESTVVLHEPAPGLDADFTLERGRVRIINATPKGQAKVRVRFLREAWDVAIPDAATEVVAELWGQFPPDVPFRKEPGGPGPQLFAALFIKGRATVQAGGKEHPMQGMSLLTWSNRDGQPRGPITIPQPPWWTDQVEFGKGQDQQGVGYALQELEKALDGKGPDGKPLEKDKVDGPVVPVPVLRKLVFESPFAASRYLGVLCLAALDALPNLVDALGDRTNGDVRASTIMALRYWIGLGPEREHELYRELQARDRYSREEAELILQLLHNLSQQDLGKPETFSRLLGLLEHDNIAVRELALWHLVRLVPDGLKVSYSATMDPASREQAVKEWKKLIPPGSLPKGLPGPGR
jgi:hypothetical protein